MRYGVIIGRFQPLHFGHINTIREALDHFDEVRVLIGSANLPRSFHNPWTYEEREAMLRLALCGEFGERVKIYRSDNTPDDVAWAKSLPEAHSHADQEECHLICPGKDSKTKEYLGWISEHNPGTYSTNWEPRSPFYSLSSTKLRSVIFNPFYDDLTIKTTLKKLVHEDVISSILEWRHSKKDVYTRLCRELEYNNKYHREVVSYPRNELTADLCLINKTGDKVLMIQRGRVPGETLWAVPGGFVDQDETTLQAAFREFKEETNVDLALYSDHWTIVSRSIADAPNRSPRARIASMITFVQMTTDEELPFIPSLPETLAVEWKSPNTMECFEDHYEIARKGLSLVR